MCECLTYQEGDRYQCEVCASLEDEKDRRLAALEAALREIAAHEDDCPCVDQARTALAGGRS